MAALMFEHLRAYRAIAVTGPQRSGTTIAAKMIAADTGYEYVDENAFRVTKLPRFRKLLTDDHVVIQCPHMLRELVDFPPADVLVVLMRRSPGDILKSQRRIGWRFARMELATFGLTEGSQARVKYDYWDSHPKPPLSLEIEYESLRGHPLWVDDRADFKPKQTRR